jgi:hypothetical protein
MPSQVSETWESKFFGIDLLSWGRQQILHLQVLIVPLRVNVNLKAVTVEEKEAQRQVRE